MVKKYHMTWYQHITTKKTNSPTPSCSRQATIIKNHIVKMIYLKNCQSFVYKGFTLIGCAFLSPVKLYNAPETGSWYTHFPFAVSVLFLSHTTLVSHSKMYWHPATYSKTGTPCNEHNGTVFWYRSTKRLKLGIRALSWEIVTPNHVLQN